MRRRLFGLLIAAASILPPAVAATSPSTASAARVLVMAKDGRVSTRIDPFLPSSLQTPAPAAANVAFTARAKPPPARKRPAPAQTVPSTLAHLYRSHQIDQSDYVSYGAGLSAALAAEKRLTGTRATELEAVIQNLDGMAAADDLTPSRLPALFLTLAENRQWWTSGPIPAPGQLIEFSGSQLAWEYYPGQGIELQVLATFGRADGMYTAGASEYPQLGQLLNEMIPLAAQRGGGLTWEYYFRWEGGSPPWTSAMSQGTALEALTRGALAFGQGTQTAGGSSAPGPPPPGSQPNQMYLQIAQRALPIFTVAPPAGVRVTTPLGARYLQYSFSPGTDIINAFLQALIGLFDYAQVSGNPEAQQLFAAGNADAEVEVPRFDTGAWSLYQPGVEDDLNYHELVTGFLDELCSRTDAPVYCTTAQHFQTYLTTPPTLQLLTTAAPGHTPFSVDFRLSKYSHVGIIMLRGQSSLFQTSASFGYGVDHFQVPSLPGGSYTVHLAATDLAGNFDRIVGTLKLSAPNGPEHRGGSGRAPGRRAHDH